MSQRIGRGNSRASRVVRHAGSCRLCQVGYIESGNAGYVASSQHKAGAIVRAVMLGYVRRLQRRFVVVQISFREQRARAVKDGATAGQSDDVAVEISRIEIVIGVRAPQRRYRVGSIFVNVAGQMTSGPTRHGKAAVTDRCATLVAAGVTNRRVYQPGIDWIAERRVVLGPGEGGPFLAHTATPHL